MIDRHCPACGDDSVTYRGHTVIHCSNPDCENHVDEVDVSSDLNLAMLEAAVEAEHESLRAEDMEN